MHGLFFCNTLPHLVTVLKIIHMYVLGCEKRNPTQILKDMHVIKSGKPDFVILDRYSLCRASRLDLNRSFSIETVVKF